MTPWSESQQRSRERIWSLIDSGHKSIVACAPTGYGKTRLVKMMIADAIERRWKWIFLTHRKMLFDQTHESFMEDMISHGFRASGKRDRWMPHSTGQLAMLPSERSKQESGSWDRYPADLVFVDEVHTNKSGFAKKLIQEYVEAGAVVIGVTATPVGLGGVFKHLEVLSDKKECRKIGALLPAKTYAPSEVDVSDIKPVADKEFSQTKLAKKFMRPQVVGDVHRHWLRLNPHGLPAVGFAPDVSGSMWFCDEFIKRGVKCAHIDGEKVYMGECSTTGEQKIYKGPEGEAMRAEVKKMAKKGEIQITWNRFVMREGVDWPFLYHLISATAFSTVQGWCQSVGRVLRSFPDYDHVIVQDHGGNVWRPGLGSPNVDSDWTLENTEKSLKSEAKERIEKQQDSEPKGCPKCGFVSSFQYWLNQDGSCIGCGHKFKLSTRKVYQTDGELKEVRGNLIKSRKPVGDAQKLWDSCYYPSKNSKNQHSNTFKQLVNRFQRDGKYKIRFRDGQTVAIHQQTSQVTILKNAPPPKSIHWERRVKSVDRGELQQ